MSDLWNTVRETLNYVTRVKCEVNKNSCRKGC